ncbi:MAG TPA: alpha/beta fold hydrolase [Lacunisphaera sp.]|nr:alpha/beta fold hydrolase [Lacunisphaera sp.]
MPTPTVRSLASFATLHLTLAISGLAAPPPVSDFVKRPDVTAAAISEDGRYVSFLTPSKKNFFDLNLYDTETRQSKLIDLGGDDVMRQEWIDGHRILLTTQNRPEYSFRQQVLDVKLGKITGNLTYRLDKGMLGHADRVLMVLSSLRRDPSLFTAWFPDFDGGRKGLAIISLNLKPKAMQGADNSRYNVKQWIDMPAGEFHGVKTDNDGEIRVVMVYRDTKMRTQYRPTPEAAWSELPLDFETTEILGFTDDPDLLYVAHYSAEARSSRLHRYRISTNDLGPALFEDPDYSMSEAGFVSVRQPDGRPRVLALAYHREMLTQRSLDPVFAAVQAILNSRLPGRLNTIHSCDQNLRRWVVGSTNGREPSRYVIYDHSDQSMLPLPAPTPWFKPAEMSVQRPIKFTARDGLVLEGYLSLPAVPSGGPKPPLVVFAHGGPWARDQWGFDRHVQLLTSRGYAVFQPNYRGSTGYSKAVSKDDAFEFRKMHDDVTDGVKYLVAQGVVDSQRLAIFGGSFGGYLAVAGAAFEPDLYKCAITFAGVFDWKQMIRQHWATSDDDKFNYDYLLKKLGDPATQEARFEQNSPIQHVAAIKAHVFVIHGKRDTTVDYRQSTKLLSELEAHQVPHEKLFFDTEVHGFIERENEQKFLEAVDQFLAKYL